VIRERRLGRSGWSLLEVLIAGSILYGTVFFGFVYFMLEMRGKAEQVGAQSRQSIDVNRILGYLNREIFNVVALNPPEPLKAGGPSVYVGLQNIDGRDTTLAAVWNGLCRFNLDPLTGEEEFSVVRYTTVENKLFADALSTRWTEASSGALALDTSPRSVGMPYLFLGAPTGAQGEVVIKEMSNSKRYFVTWSGTQLSAGPVARYTGQAIPALVPQISFAIGSFVYPVQTKIVCIHPTSNHLMEYVQNPASGALESPRVLLNPSSDGLRVTGFRLEYANIKSGDNVETRPFIGPFMTVPGTWHTCWNAGRITLVYKHVNGDARALVRQNKIFLKSLAAVRSSVVCDPLADPPPL
jgi:hypothetical protein